MPAATLPAAEGHVIALGHAWRYRIESLLGQSSFGCIWLSRQLQTGEALVLKTVRHEYMQAVPAAQRQLWPDALRHEAALLRRLRHRHVIGLLHHGEHEGMPVLALEKMDGDLNRLLKAQGGTLAWAAALEVLRQVAGGLAYLHALGLRHLDLKPGNLLTMRRGPLAQVKLADLGISRQSDASELHPFAGSPGWLAPEQALPALIGPHGGDLYRTSAQTDHYALGLLLFHLLTGGYTLFSQSVSHALAQAREDLRHQHAHFARLGAAGLTSTDQALLQERLTARGESHLLPRATRLIQRLLVQRDADPRHFVG